MTYPAVDVTAQAELSGVTVYKDVEAKIVSTSASVSIGNGAEETSASFLVPFNDAGAGSVNTTPTYGTGPATFTRATTATTVNSAGLVVSVGTGVARSMYDPSSFITNLCLQSQTLDDASWIKTNTTVTANLITSPDGTVTADKLVEALDVGQAHQTATANWTDAATTYTYSIFAKAAERSKFSLQVSTLHLAGGASASFDLVAVSTSSLVNCTTAITAYPNGWYRCSITFTTTLSAAGGNFINLINAAGATSYNGDGASGAYFWGGQIEQGSTANQYVSTTTALRSDFGKYLGYLAEGARTNLTNQSEDFSTSWVKLALTVTSNVVVSPDGNTTADFLKEDNTNAEHELEISIPYAISSAYTGSVWVKQNTGTRNVRLMLYTNSAADIVSVIVNPSTGAIVSGPTLVGAMTAASCTVDTYPNGWFRIKLSGTTSGTAGPGAIRLSLTSGTTIVYVGDNTSGISAWGTQVELGPFASSYIPTLASAITRNADALTYASAGNAATAVGTVYAEATPYALDVGAQGVVSINDGTTNNRVDLRVSSPNVLTGIITSGGAAQANNTVATVFAAKITSKVAGYWNTNAENIIANGTVGTLDATVTVPAAFTTIQIGQLDAGTANALFGTIKNVRIWPIQLSDTTLQRLTS